MNKNKIIKFLPFAGLFIFIYIGITLLALRSAYGISNILSFSIDKNEIINFVKNSCLIYGIYSVILAAIFELVLKTKNNNNKI